MYIHIYSKREVWCVLWLWICIFLCTAQPSAPTELSCNLTCQERINRTSQLENGSSLVSSTCQQVKLVISWESAKGMFDWDYYSVNIVGYVTNVNTTVNIVRNVSTTSFEVLTLPNGDYQVFIRTFSKCQEASRAAKTDVKAGKQSYTLYII